MKCEVRNCNNEATREIVVDEQYIHYICDSEEHYIVEGDEIQLKNGKVVIIKDGEYCYA